MAREIFKRSGRSFVARWREVLDHPATRTLLIAFQIAAFSIGAVGFYNALGTLQTNSRMTAFQVLNLSQATQAAKWQAVATLLSFDWDLPDLDTGCAREDHSLRLAVFDSDACGQVDDVNVMGEPANNRRLDRISVNGTIFKGGTWENLEISKGAMTNDMFSFDAMRHVKFSQMDTRWSVFQIGPVRSGWIEEGVRSDPAMFDEVTFFRSNLEDDVFYLADAPWHLHFFISNISGVELSGVGVTRNSVGSAGSWFVRGSPPTINGHPELALADYVCSKELAPGELAHFSAECSRLRWLPD